MPRIGVFGAMASGKSTVSKWFREWGAALVEGDALGWSVLAEPEIVAALRAEFGPGIVDAPGGVDRARLGRVVFAEPSAMDRLNALVQPRLRARVREALEVAPPGVVVLDAAMLTTWGLEPELDGVVEVRAGESRRLERLRASRGFSEAEALERIRGQRLPPVRNAKRHWILHNDGGLAGLRRAAEELWREIASLR
ncbi:MAG TPA: dephospho-CoA kinase [Candidatus Eisenbacteria bacterium]|nr:dephospho-CoA kinase [Candidatus Eisenbacteria bacterium]